MASKRDGERVFEVCLGDDGIPVGTLWIQAEGGRHYSVFRYAESWLRHPRGFAIAPSMPLHTDRQFFRKTGERGSFLPPPLADTVPDLWGRRLMNAYNGSQGLSEIEYLVGVDDQSRLGALRLRIAGGPFLAEKPTDRPSLPPVLDIDLITRDIARIERDHPDREALARLVGGGSSLGGARPKCTVVLADGGLALAKFTSRHDQHAIEKAEVLTLKLARLCGLDAPDAELIQSGPLPVALIRRFDRGKTGRVPYLSAQSFLGMAEATGGTYVDFADMLRKQALLPELSVRELFARVGFSILVSNTDDHLKNHGLLAGGNGQWRLSPLFDVNPSPERERYLKTAIADPGESQASLELLVDQAESFGLSSGEARRLVADQAQCIRAQWQPLAKQLGMSRAEIRDYQPAFEHPESDWALRRGQSTT